MPKKLLKNISQIIFLVPKDTLIMQKKIPILYPDYPNIKEYIKTTNVPITFTDKNIAISKKKSDNIQKTTFNKNATQLVVFSSGTTGNP